MIDLFLIALASSNIPPENPSKMTTEIKNSNKTNSSEGNVGSSPIQSDDLLNRKSREIPFSESLESLQTAEEREFESQSNNMDGKIFITSTTDDLDKRAIPMIRFGRSSMSMVPTLRFGRSGKSMIPTIRFGRSDASMIPTIRFGRSDSSMIPTIRFGRSDASMIPSMRFGRSDSSMIPSMRFGRSETSMIPTIRFGRSDASMIPTMRFGRAGTSMIPTMRFGRSDDSMIPMPRFGRTFEHSGDTSSEKDLIIKETYEDEDEGPEDQNLTMEQYIDKSDSVISNSNLGRGSGTDSERTSNSLDFINRILKRQTNDSLIPQIRYGRSSLKTKKSKEIKPPFFTLPNIRPGRSANENLDTSEETSEPYFSDVQGFLGLFGAFRRSDDDIKDDSRNLDEMELGKKVEDLLFDANADNTYKQFEKQLYNKDPLYVIPYPRPGKRQLGKSPSMQKGIEKSNGMSSPHLFKINKISDYVLPYPRPGKKSQGTGNISYIRSKRSASIPYPRPGRSYSALPYPRPGRSYSALPYPRPGRSYSVVPYPRPGRSMVILPYPRPGRSSTDYMLPYPRPGKSEQSSFSDYDGNKLDYQNESKRTKRSTQNYELEYLFSPETKKTAGNVISVLESFENKQGSDGNEYNLLNTHDLNNFLNTIKGHDANSNSVYMLPYPRPGRDV